ncbi:unnamed protein product [Adineta ricciae]|uniref:Uncharacterized protein n=1 Tax=Adineta ricciae TaxID=249248 RepID=A0A814PX70_ADIRI|nr:unnamed protein product [Adineta ricciae]CAF1111603.1 unnamed protein product [Adineta ricciae]
MILINLLLIALIAGMNFLTYRGGRSPCGSVGCYDPNTQGCSGGGSTIQCINSCNGICYSNLQDCYNNTKIIIPSVLNNQKVNVSESERKCYDNTTQVCFSENSTICPIGNQLCSDICYNPQSQYCIGGNNTIFCLTNPSSSDCRTTTIPVFSNSTSTISPSTTVPTTSASCCAIQNCTLDADCCQSRSHECLCLWLMCQF